ncbi:MAG: hypothetical protein U1E98_03690 [Moraxella osloensis]
MPHDKRLPADFDKWPGVVKVKGRSRVPLPADKIMAWVMVVDMGVLSLKFFNKSRFNDGGHPISKFIKSMTLILLADSF